MRGGRIKRDIFSMHRLAYIASNYPPIGLTHLLTDSITQSFISTLTQLQSLTPHVFSCLGYMIYCNVKRLVE